MIKFSKDSAALAIKELEQYRDACNKKHIAEVDKIRQLQTYMFNELMLGQTFKCFHWPQVYR